MLTLQETNISHRFPKGKSSSNMPLITRICFFFPEGYINIIILRSAQSIYSDRNLETLKPPLLKLSLTTHFCHELDCPGNLESCLGGRFTPYSGGLKLAKDQLVIYSNLGFKMFFFHQSNKQNKSFQIVLNKKNL